MVLYISAMYSFDIYDPNPYEFMLKQRLDINHDFVPVIRTNE